jgi:hypothetical protein
MLFTSTAPIFFPTAFASFSSFMRSVRERRSGSEASQGGRRALVQGMQHLKLKSDDTKLTFLFSSMCSNYNFSR